ncbi:hypothetical protein GGI1_05331 [Acidithiobacillus sp. GGI-221]|nr:hypothetical protein GGI1_05331 [Acidithiobacillus sp. GGI-221]
MSEIIVDPWTEEQVEKLNRLQRGELYGHPYTCPNRGDTPHHDNGNDKGCLLATKNGWLCPDCGYTQNWAHKSSLNALPLTKMLRHMEIQVPLEAKP